MIRFFKEQAALRTMALAWAAASWSALVLAEAPPGFGIQQLTHNSRFEYRPKLNNRGQVVYLRAFGRYADSDDLYFFDGRRHIRITNDETGYIRDTAPDINDDGTIVWSRAIGPDGPYGPTLEVMICRDGEITRLTDNDTDDWAGSINGLGQVAWDHLFDAGACSMVGDVFVWNGEETRRVSWDGENSDGIFNQGAVMNDAGDVVWTRYDFCQSPWTSTIQLYRNGQTLRISEEDEYFPQVAAISDCGVAAWGSLDVSFQQTWLMTWKDGVRTMLTDWGSNPRLNCRGDVYFIRWHEATRAWQAWYYSNDLFYHLSEGDPTWNTDGDINEAGECVWSSGDRAIADIKYLSRPVRRILQEQQAGSRQNVLSEHPVVFP